MVKNKLDYKLLNILIFILIIYLIYQTLNFWVGAVSIVFQSLLPFLLAFAIAYIVNPLVNKLSIKLSRSIAIAITVLIFFLIVFIIIYLLFPLLLKQLGNLFTGIISFVQSISIRENINSIYLEEELLDLFSNILEKTSSYITGGILSFIISSINILSKILIVLAAAIYFLIDMEKIKKALKLFFIKHNKKTYYYLKELDKQMSAYISGFLKIVVISFFEYTFVYFIIGHPNYLTLGALASIMNFIPYFGGIITNLIAAITAFVVSSKLFWKTIVVFIICSIIDGYIINPLVYKKSNKIHPLIIIVAVFTGGVLFGAIGIVIALPFTVFVITTYNYFKKDIYKLIHHR